MLAKIEIKNFRSCYATTIDFSESVCALVGKNGVGKSNVLKCIDWLASSSIATGPVDLSRAGKVLDKSSDVSTQAFLELDGRRYIYGFAAPLPAAIEPRKPFTLRDRLSVEENGKWVQLFTREGEKIFLSDRDEPIRIPRSTPSIAALLSLLPEGEAIQGSLESVASFFAKVRYYDFEERKEYRDFVTARRYEEWLVGFQNEGTLTDSVALRLIYMWTEDRLSFSELVSILGPDGLGLVEHMTVGMFDASPGPAELMDEGGTGTKVFMPLFRPSTQMGGSGHSFAFSDLSVGTRRAIRIVTSLLFDRRSLMLVEQPEDSIHPGLLRKLIDTMRSYAYDSQIIFTTHSSEVLDILRPEELLMTNADRGRTTVRSLSENELLQAKKFLANEGSLSDFLEPLEDQ